MRVDQGSPVDDFEYKLISDLGRTSFLVAASGFVVDIVWCWRLYWALRRGLWLISSGAGGCIGRCVGVCG